MNVYPFIIRFKTGSSWIVTAPGQMAKATPDDLAKVRDLVRQEKNEGLNFWSRVY